MRNRSAVVLVLFILCFSSFAESAAAMQENSIPKPLKEEQKESQSNSEKRTKSSAKKDLNKDTSTDASSNEKVTNKSNEQSKIIIEPALNSAEVSQKKKPKTEEVERFVMPFTNWLEGKLHNSKVINPTQREISRSKQTTPKTNLRSAIKQALASYPGTVLSADKSTRQGMIEYRVKIISTSGVIKIITVSDIAMEKQVGK